MKNSADLRGCYPPRPSASVDNTLLDLQNSSYPTQPHSIIAKYLGCSYGRNMALFPSFLPSFLQYLLTFSNPLTSIQYRALAVAWTQFGNDLLIPSELFLRQCFLFMDHFYLVDRVYFLA